MLRYEQRAKLCTNPTAIKLFELMANKKTNLALSADLIQKKDLLNFADQLGPEICVLKTHIDILEDFDSGVIKELQALAKRHQFIIFEDRKFADIGNTVKLQYEKGIYKIASWANITNAHTVSGPGIIDGLKKAGLPLGNGLLLLAQMSSVGSLAKGDYTEETLQMALNNKDFVIGFITQKKLLDDPCFINMTPGVKMSVGPDDLGQQYISVWDAIYHNQSDIIIVGRGIYHHADALEVAKQYRQQGWDAYLQRIDNSP